MHLWLRVPSTAAASRSSPAAAPRSSPSTTAASSASARSKRLGNFVQLQDTYGNTYTYARLAKVAKSYPAPRQRTTTAKQVAKELKLPAKDAAPTAPASSTTEKATKREAAAKTNTREARGKTVAKPAPQAPSPPSSACSPTRSAPTPGAPAASSRSSSAPARSTARSSFKNYFSKVFGLDRKDVRIKRLRPGSRVVAGTILGRIGKTSSTQAPHVLFEIRPAGRGAPRIDPKPILDGWKLLESTAIYRAAGKNPFFGPDAKQPTIGQILLMSKEALVQHVLANPRIELYSCGRDDIRTGQVDRRVLATLEFLAASGMRPTVTSLRCGHGLMTASGNVSQHSSGNAVDIARINGIPILGNQGAGSITELAVRRLLTLQGTMKPDQIITLMEFDGADNTLAMADHNDHIHVGWKPLYGTNSKAVQAGQRRAEAQAVDQADRPARGDRQPDGAPPALQARAEGHRARLRGAQRRVRGAAASRRFSFVQWEFAGRLGPEAGRYVIRRYAGDDPRHIVVIGELGPHPAPAAGAAATACRRAGGRARTRSR